MHLAKKAIFSSMAFLAICLLTVRPALSQTPYYAGKTITIIRGGGPGGSGEFQSRALMPYLKKYIPGNPTITMEFMDGPPGGRQRTTSTRRNLMGSRSDPPAP
jgi:tripartite-type tricarboxylate transporter receptor subunit TctC